MGSVPTTGVRGRISVETSRYLIFRFVNKEARSHCMNNRISPLKIALLTGGIDKHYACGLSQSLAQLGIVVDVICNSEMDTPEMREYGNARLLKFYATPQRHQNKLQKLLAIFGVYARLLYYGATSSAPIFHILWNYKFTFFDRTLLLIYYKLLGKQLVFTAHNVNAGERDGSDSLLNRVSLRAQYRLVDHIFVHTQKMKDQLVERFGAREERITVIPFGTYDMVPQSSLTPAGAKQRLGLCESDRTILFFGRITPYKGIDLLVDAFARVALQDQNYRLVIAGEPMKEGEQQWQQVQRAIEQSGMQEQVVQHARFIGDNEIELFFKGADVLVLPYTQIFQSGVLFMAYSFGLPVIATDVGSFGRDILEGKTGYVCRPNDAVDLARVIEMYFSSELFRTLGEQRGRIKDLIHAGHSWDITARKTGDIYAQLSRYSELQYST
jgi:D-inositol-3-phosphate glycosyltransferase